MPSAEWRRDNIIMYLLQGICEGSFELQNFRDRLGLLIFRERPFSQNSLYSRRRKRVTLLKNLKCFRKRALYGPLNNGCGPLSNDFDWKKSVYWWKFVFCEKDFFKSFIILFGWNINTFHLITFLFLKNIIYILSSCSLK